MLLQITTVLLQITTETAAVAVCDVRDWRSLEDLILSGTMFRFRTLNHVECLRPKVLDPRSQETLGAGLLKFSSASFLIMFRGFV